jgi:biotin transport system permease protein
MAGRIARYAPFCYRGGSTPLHRASAGIKLAGLLVLSAAAFGSLPALAVSALLVAVFAVLARIKPWQLLRGAKPLTVLALFLLIFKTVDPASEGFYFWRLHLPISRAGFVEGLFLALRIFVSFAAGSLLFAVTTMGSLRRFLARAERGIFVFFRRLLRANTSKNEAGNVRYSRISLGISLMLGFLPRFFELWEDANLACDARCGKKGLYRIKVLIPLVTERMMETAADTAEALEARGIR